MTEGKKRCGLSSFLPMSCRGRAEAFARRLHSRLRSLGSQDDSNSCATENSWLASTDISNSAVTSLQPRHTADNGVFMDFAVDYGSPGSPEEEDVAESELANFITNSKDDLHLTNLDECDCMKKPAKGVGAGKRNSVDSDSSEGTYFDPENGDADTNCMLSNQMNGISSGHSSASRSEEIVIKPEGTKMVALIPSSSECTISSLSRTISEDEPFASLYEDSLTDILSEEQFENFTPVSEVQSTSGWKLSYEPKRNCNNNTFNAIDLQSLTTSSIRNHDEENKEFIDEHLSTRCSKEEDKQKIIDDKICWNLIDDKENRSITDQEDTRTIFCNDEIKTLVNYEENNRILEEKQNTFDNVENTILFNDKEEGTKIQNEESSKVFDNEENRIIGNQENELNPLILNGQLEENQETSTNKESNVQNFSSDEDKESYCSHLNIQQNFTVECPNSTSCTTPKVHICTLEISEPCHTDVKEESVVTEEVNKTENTNNLKVTSPIEIDTEDNELEDRIPRVRRCSSLKTGKTPPGTPGRKKIVRFADVLGLDLADVRTFMDEIPKIPISAYDDLSDAYLSLSMSDTSLGSASSSTMNALHMPTKTLVPLFQQPGGEANFFDKVRERQVCLENAVIQDPEAPCVCGTVRVRNLDFNKSVHIRYTIDAWKSFADLQAKYVGNSCDGFSDKFSFTLYVHTLSVGQRLDFAVRFQCKGCQYWDNNGGQNYTIQCLPACLTTSYLPITEPDDINWGGAAFY